MIKFKLSILSAALCFAASTGAVAAVLSTADFKAAKGEISAVYKADKAACNALSGNAGDVCKEEAKGKEKVAIAVLEMNQEPTEKHQYDLRMTKANSAYAIAKEKCDDFAGNAKDVCHKEAKSALVAAQADAKVAEKTADANATANKKSADANATANKKSADANATARAKTTEVRRDAATDKRNADYAVAKEKCDALAGDAKAGCVKNAKALYGQS